MEPLNIETRSSPISGAQRRRSGRIIKPPQKFTSVVTPSRATSKRKRRADVESDSPDPGDDDSSDTSKDDIHDKQPKSQRKSQKAKKPSAKRHKPHGRPNLAVNDVMKLPSRLKKNINRRVVVADKDSTGLHAELFSSGNRPQDIAAQWLQKYRENDRQALADLVNLILRSSGCNIEVTVDDVDDIDNVDGRLVDVQSEFQMQNISEYPLISRAKSNQSFRGNLTGFFDKLIEVLHESEVLYEETILLENIHQWVAALSSSTTRPFRHTATLIALTMTSARCRIAHTEIEKAAKVQRQLESEAKSKKPNKARLADFQRRVDKNNERKAIIESQIQDYFETVYLHRYRDIDPKIRLECTEALGTWIVTMDSYFYDGQYLRYLGWMLYDTHGPIRQAIVMQIQKIMKTLNHGGIRHFIDRFRSRLIEMATRDSELAVRVHTVELLTLIRDAEMLEPDDIDDIGRLILDAELRVRKSVVNFFISNVNDLYETRLQEIYSDDAQEHIKNMLDEDGIDSPRPSWIKFKCLAEILVEYDTRDQADVQSRVNLPKFLEVNTSESRFTLAAQALFERMQELREWVSLAGYILYDHTTSTKKLDNDMEHLFLEAVIPNEKEEVVLLEILTSVVKSFLQRLEEPSKMDRKKHSKADIVEAKEIATRQLADIITRSLNRYGADPQAVTIVLRLAQVLDYGFFHDEIQQISSNCSRLLDQICAQFKSHADTKVLTEASFALLHARGFEELEELTNNKIQLLWEESISMLQKVNQAGEISVRGGSFSQKTLIEISHILARIDQLSSISDPIEFMEADSNTGEPCPITLIFDIIARGELLEGNNVTFDSIEDTIVQCAMRSGLFYFMWKTLNISNASENQSISESNIDQLKERQEIFIANLIASFSSRADLDEVRLLGASIYIDLHVTFVSTLGFTPTSENERKDKTNSSKADHSSDSIFSLIKQIDADVQQELSSIFCDLERQFAKKSKKKLNAPGDDEAPEDLDSDSEDEDIEDEISEQRQIEILASEKQLCQFTGKICLAILAQVLDFSGPLSGKLRARLLRNRQLLGPNFKEIVSCLDESKTQKSKKTSKNKSPLLISVDERKKLPLKSAEFVENDVDDIDNDGGNDENIVNEEDDMIEDIVDPFIEEDKREGLDSDGDQDDIEDFEEKEREEEGEEENESEKLLDINEDDDTIMGD
ncbi:Cohesin subunit psc3 [Erysiphe neolycopersici]|uniref:Cohesin subunit psc3 n=1 Tax=Erysiphe neolycopersici TaxID=212602 RepID=A0A420HRE4_9PEZI|nr:Cohesin subunit psc3 [Erysiphe neolycopersici]